MVNPPLSFSQQMSVVLDLLPKLLSLCTSPSNLVDSDIEGGGVSALDFRVFSFSSHKQNRIIQHIIDRNWGEGLLCPIISSLRVFLFQNHLLQESNLSDDLIITVVNKISTMLSKMKEVHIASVIYQILLLTNPNVARVVLISILLNIRKKCSAEQLPSIINHFAFALRNNAVFFVSC